MSGPQRQCSGEPTCRLPNDNLLGSRQICSRTPDSRPVGSPTTICWGADTSAPQRQLVDLSVPQRRYAVEPTCLLPNARQPTCRLPTPICWGADTSAPERQLADLSVPQRRYAGEPTRLGSNADVRLVVADPDIIIAIGVRFVRKQK